MTISLSQACAAVTGASKGIGRAAAEMLLEHGVAVAAVSKTEPDLLRVVEEWNIRWPGMARAFPADISREEEAVRVIKEIAGAFGKIDILLNCAGVSQHGAMPLSTIDRAEFERILHTNLNSVLYCIRETLPYMERQPHGFIFSVLSTAAFHSSGGGTAYAASKYAARAVMEGLGQAYKGTHIRIASISPGPVNTNIWSHKTVPVSQERKEKMLQPQDIAQIILFLLQLDDNVHISNLTVEPWFYKKQP